MNEGSSSRAVREWTVRHIKLYWRMLSLVLLLQVLSAALISVQPVFYQRLISLVATGRNSFPVADGLRLLCSLGLVYLLSALTQGLSGYVVSLFSSGLLKQLQVDFFEKVMKLPLRTLHKQEAGEYFTRFSYDTSQAERFVVEFLPTFTRDFLTALAVTAVLVYSCPLVLTATSLGIVILTSCLLALLHYVMERFARIQREKSGAINSLLDETLQGIDTLKTLASEKRRGRRFECLTQEMRDISVKAGAAGAGFATILETISKFGSILLLYLAYRMISHGQVEVKPFLLFFFYAGMLQMTVSSLVSSFGTFQPELVGLRNVARFLAEPVEEGRAGDSGASSIRESVVIEAAGLTFGYPGERLLFDDARLHAPARGTTLIHGPSGSGKSTLINLLLRFYAPLQGTILFGGAPIDGFSRTELRRKLGVVTQDHFIFSESLRENIRISNPDADDDRILEALERARLGELVRRLPGGLDCRLDPRGKGLSAGERQRICLARVLLRDPPVMLLDEPWSNLDQDVRGLIADVINECRGSKTVVIMSHEDIPSLRVDRVYRLIPESGKFIEENRHGRAKA